MSGLDLTRGTCGEFLGKLVGRLSSSPGYVRPEHVPWLSTLLSDFCEFEFNSPYAGAHIPRGKACDLPLEFLKFYARHWIESKHLQSAPLQTLAIAALQVADEHLRERPDVGQAWKIRGAQLRLEALTKELQYEPWFFDEIQFKQNFTRQHRGTPLVAELPSGGRLNFRRTGMGMTEGSFRFFLDRFHLTEATTTIYDHVFTFETTPSPFSGYDILDASTDGIAGVIDFQERPYNGRIPIGWLRGEYLHGNNNQEEVFNPIPSWLGFPMNLAPPARVCSFSEVES
ncbi:hypothetical protein [Corallococcus exiguus]|uniref:hypothetical protein n=1 Tax=Corallococcus exiguus TaxID=83462 RepID=UPI001470BCC0|nr:hypothetical protein [Corallococcus exiguus]NNB89644.1 hypothetical protein [Corallococcus exiguus]